MRKYTIFISFVLSLIICINIFSTNIIADNIDIFNDVKEDDWFYNNLSELKSQNIISGFPDGSFRGNSKLTIDQTIKMLTQAFGYTLEKADGYWAQNYINKANSLKWFKDLSISNYKVNINRYETCKIIVNAFGETISYPDNINDYNIYIKDYDSIPEKYKLDVLKSYYLGIISGYPDGNFNGNNSLTRAESTSIIYRIINSVKRIIPIDPISVSKLNEVFNEVKSVNNYLFKDNIKFENNKFYYKKVSGIWSTKDSMKINTYISNSLETILSNMLLATVVNDFSDYKVEIDYSDSKYLINYKNNSNTNIFNISNDNVDTITINIGNLYDNQNNLDSKLTFILYGICQSISVDKGKEIYSYILTNYYNKEDIPNEGFSKTIEKYQIKMINNEPNINVNIEYIN